jgi:phosphonate transport system ATP-binding protein
MILSTSNHAAIELDDVWYAYDGSRFVLNGISLAVAQGSAMAIVGHSGSGKTTLLKLINGLLTPSRGIVHLFGNGVNGDVQLNGARARVGYIPQQLGLVRNATAVQNVLVGALPRVGQVASVLGRFPPDEVALASRLLDQVGLAGRAGEQVHHLSGGERQRVAIARALMQKPSILLADEFISDLDDQTAYEVMDLIESIHKEGVTLVMVTHDLAVGARYAERAVLLHRGRKLTECKASELRYAETPVAP